MTGSVPSPSFGRNHGNPVRHRAVESQPAPLHQRQRRDGNDRLRQGGEPEDGIFPNTHLFLPVGETGGAAVNDLSVFGHQDDRADDALFPDRLIDHGIKA